MLTYINDCFFFGMEERRISSGAFLGILSPIIATTLMATIGWRAMFYIIGFIGIVLTAIFWFYIKDPKPEGENLREEINHIPVNFLTFAIKIPLYLELVHCFF